MENIGLLMRADCKNGAFRIGDAQLPEGRPGVDKVKLALKHRGRNFGEVCVKLNVISKKFRCSRLVNMVGDVIYVKIK